MILIVNATITGLGLHKLWSTLHMQVSVLQCCSFMQLNGGPPLLTLIWRVKEHAVSLCLVLVIDDNLYGSMVALIYI